MGASTSSGPPSKKAVLPQLISYREQSCAIFYISLVRTFSSPCLHTIPTSPQHPDIAGSFTNIQLHLCCYVFILMGPILFMHRLMSIYESIHASVHAKHTHVKMHCFVSQSASSFAWITPVFEFYCVAGPNANRNALAMSASKIVRWVQQEEERLFIIGGAVSHCLLYPALPRQ